MAEASELKAVVKQLQGVQSEKEIIDILTLLKKDFVVNESILRESKAGLAVGKLRHHASKDISTLAKDLVKKWKTEVEQAKLAAGNGHGAGKDSKTTTAKAATPVRKSSMSAAPSSPTIPHATRTLVLDGVNANIVGDKTRDKCIELLYNSLASDSPAPTEQILQKSKVIEKSVLEANGGTTAAYKAKVRSLFMNLQDKNNPGLREAVVSGDISAEKLHTMSSEELASEDRKKENKQIQNENLFASLGAGEQQAETDAFQCSRCKQRKCRYRQAQTRSADEPMTTFVTCTVCNNRWKFS